MKPNWDKLYRQYCDNFTNMTDNGDAYEFKKFATPSTVFVWFKEKLNWTDEDLLNFAISYYNYRQKEPITISDYLEIWKNERNNKTDRVDNSNLSK